MIGTTEHIVNFRREQQKSARIAQTTLEYGEDLYKLRADYLAGKPKKLRDTLRLRGKRAEKALLDEESSIGHRIFGPVDVNHRREFFNLAPDVWIWHEEEIPEDGTTPASQTTRYEINKRGIKKVRLGRQNNYLKGSELENFGRATAKYFELAKKYYEAK
jgi:hypothetical protein